MADRTPATDSEPTIDSLRWSDLRTLQSSDGEKHLAALRLIRNDVCQTMNRSTFSRGASGHDEECMQRMICGILRYLVHRIDPPRAQLASVLGGSSHASIYDHREATLAPDAQEIA